jgi:HlyD family secretion protein
MTFSRSRFRLLKAAAAPPTSEPRVAPHLEEERLPRPPGSRRRLLWLAFSVLVVVAITLLVRWRVTAPATVVVIRPTPRTVVETVAASGRVSARRDTVIGAQIQGVVAELYVDEGDLVTRGQALARIRNDVAEAQVRQAEQALRTAQAQLAQAAAGPRTSELEAARAQVRQASATARQRAAQLAEERARLAQAEAAVQQRVAEVARARAAVRSAEAGRDFARSNRDRYRSLLAEGAVARQTVEQAESEFQAAEAEVAAAREGVSTAEAGVDAARAGVSAARQAVANARGGVAAARAAVSAAEQELRTLAAGPRAEAVAVARQRVRDAQAALRVAREQAQTAIVRAPFPGTVTAIVAEPGAPVGSGGVVRLVQTAQPEILADVDESNLADLRVGQRAVITSTTFRGKRLAARVREIGAQVDVARGTIEVTVVPEGPSDWLRPGQTVDVNIITAEAARRLVVPRSAIRREGDRTVVLLARDGQAVAKTVVIGPVEGDVVPVIEGLAPDDPVIRDATRVEPGARVRVRRSGD